jgi:hypothetical protein
MGDGFEWRDIEVVVVAPFEVRRGFGCLGTWHTAGSASAGNGRGGRGILTCSYHLRACALLYMPTLMAAA